MWVRAAFAGARGGCMCGSSVEGLVEAFAFVVMQMECLKRRATSIDQVRADAAAALRPVNRPYLS